MQWLHGFISGVHIAPEAVMFEAFEALAAHPSGRFLISLDLSDDLLGSDGLAAWLASPALRGLARLSLSGGSSTESLAEESLLSA